jgi:hypothetical protein
MQLIRMLIASGDEAEKKKAEELKYDFLEEK